jgi:CBS domain-containing protein
MSERWIRHLPVLEGGRLVGIVSQRDLAGVLAGALNEPEDLRRLIEGSALPRERRLKRIEAGDLD